jgi:hypothetical protein
MQPMNEPIFLVGQIKELQVAFREVIPFFCSCGIYIDISPSRHELPSPAETITVCILH